MSPANIYLADILSFIIIVIIYSYLIFSNNIYNNIIFLIVNVQITFIYILTSFNSITGVFFFKDL